MLALALVALSAAAVQVAAQDAPSVAEAARRSRQQKQESQKPAKIVTNDTLPAAPQANPPATPAEASAPVGGAAANETKTAADTPEDAEQKKAEIDSLRKQIAAKQDEINTQQARIALDQNTYYSNPDYSRDSAGKAKLDGEKGDLERMQEEISELKARLQELGEPIPSKAPEPKKSITQNAPPS
jgi:chromosome segregation ATPase